ncbi:MAG: hypothetical protein QNJ29_01105 [Rhizobiaceae bacterium]|nr:hypothetical protein [Rhizobiaceae bacterium]
MFKNKYLTTASLLALLTAAGCQSQQFEADYGYRERIKDYHSRHEGITTHAGDQLAVNEAQMVSDPWKSRADNTHLHGNGKRIADAVTRYENNGKEKIEIGGPVGAAPGLPSGQQ